MKAGCGLVQIQDIRLAKELGFDYVEYMGKKVAAMEETEFQKMVLLLEQEGMVCGGLNGYCPKELVMAGPGYEYDAAKAYAKRLAARASQLGAAVVGIGSPYSRMLPDGFNRETAKRQLKDFLKVTAEEMRKYGIMTCLEALAPCYCNFINCTEEAIEIVREIGWDSMKLVLDFYNMEYLKEADIDIGRWVEYIGHVHISDDAGTPFSRYFLKPEKAGLHQKRLRRLWEGGYNGLVTIEVDLPIDRAAAGCSLDILRRSFPDG